eukprot:4166774-Lingulodinium_polyedra.AAC.1
MSASSSLLLLRASGAASCQPRPFPRRVLGVRAARRVDKFVARWTILSVARIILVRRKRARRCAPI